MAAALIVIFSAVCVRAQRFAVLLVAAVIGLTACSSGASKPVTLPSLAATTSSSPTPTATSTASQLAAVEAVVRRYYALLNAPTSAATAAAVEKLTTAKCVCREVAKAMRRVVDERQHFFGSSKIMALVSNIDSASSADVLVTYDYSRGGIASGDGTVVSSSRGRRGAVRDYRLIHIGDSWLIDDVLSVEPGKPA